MKRLNLKYVGKYSYQYRQQKKKEKVAEFHWFVHKKNNLYCVHDSLVSNQLSRGVCYFFREVECAKVGTYWVITNFRFMESLGLGTSIPHKIQYDVSYKMPHMSLFVKNKYINKKSA